MGKQVEELTAGNFSDRIAKGVTLVDFWAPWCGPCKTQGPRLEKAVGKAGDHVTVAKLNVDEAQDIAAEHKVRSLPTIVIFKDGKEVKRLAGPQQEDDLVKDIKLLT